MRFNSRLAQGLMSPRLGRRQQRHERADSGDEWEVPSAHHSTLARTGGAPEGTQSLDFDLCESKQYVEYVSQLSKKSRKLKGGIRWLLIFSTGICTGLIAVLIDEAVKSFFTLRSNATQHLAQAGYSIAIQYVVHVGICLVLSSIAGVLVCFVEPLAAGSGIPEVKCYLNGVDLPRIVNLRTLLAKAPGVMFSVSAGLPCGKEGPMIHSGAVVGAVLSTIGNGPLLRPYRVSTETRDFVAAGAAAGVAAAFGAPVGGVLFAVEEGASFMNPAIMLRTFVSSTAAALTTHFFLGPLDDEGNRQNVRFGEMGSAAPLSFGFFPRESYMIWELGIWALMGACGGICGALFNATNTQLTYWRMRHIGGRGVKRFIEVMVVTITISSIYFITPMISGFQAGNKDIGKFSSSELLFWKSGTSSITALFHEEEDFDGFLLLYFAVTYYVLACWTYGLGVPSGLFVPSLLTGAAFGRLFGQAMRYWGMTTTSAGIYALMGATAFLAGMARITISLAVILMEATGSTTWALPIFLVVMASKWTGDVFTIGLYDIHIGLKHVPLLETFPEKDMIIMRARDVMNRDVLAVERVETVKALLAILQGCSHHGFPVIHHERKHFIGMVKRSTIHEVLYFAKRHGVLQAPNESLTSEVPIIPYAEIMAWYPKYPTIEDIQNEIPQDMHLHRIDLGPYMNRGGYTVPEYAALTRVYMLFRTMGLRHLPVVSHDGDVVGTITRKDLILKHGEIKEGGVEPHLSIVHNSFVPTSMHAPTGVVETRRSGEQRGMNPLTTSVTTSHGTTSSTRRDSLMTLNVGPLNGGEVPCQQPERTSVKRRQSLVSASPATSVASNPSPMTPDAVNSEAGISMHGVEPDIAEEESGRESQSTSHASLQ